MSDAALSFGLGIFTGQARPGSGIDVSGEYRAIPEIAAAAEARGFAAIWLSEHHGADDSYLPSPMPMLAAVAAVTHRIRLGTAVLVPALHDPVRLAEDIAVVDQLSAGRVTIGFGLGWRSAEFAAAGVKLVERVGRTTEAIALLRHLFSGNPAPFAGRYHRIPRPRLRPLPFQPGGPPILLAGSQESSIRRAARIGDGLIYSRTGPTAAAVQPTLRHIADALRWIDEGFGPRPGEFPVTLLLNLALAEDGDPWAVVGPGVDHQFRTYAAWKSEEAGEAFGAERATAAIAAGRAVTIQGDASAIRMQLKRWIDAVYPRRPLHLVVKLHYPGVTARRTIRALDRFARDVMGALSIGPGAAVRTVPS